jgi:SAM-dependent methyltransferase
MSASTNQRNESSAATNAVAYWDQVLDPQNLERDENAGRLGLEAEIGFAQTPDFAVAARWLEGGAARPAFVVDLGAGLGANAFALARRGHTVLAVDSSPARLKALRARAAQAGCAGSIRCVVALAEHLPFGHNTVPGIYTKSVLIHTDLPRAAAELARVLRPAGRAALVEPQPGNPFVALYRRTLAPQAWRGITRYFGAPEQAIFVRAIDERSAVARQVRPCYFFGFFAFVFQFAWPRRRLFRAALAFTQTVDGMLFAIVPGLRKWAWFGVICVAKPAAGEERKG